MPTYEYQCQACQKEFTIVQSMAEHDQKQNRCPGCESDQITQRFSSFYARTSKKS